jgi:hypothetical protein
VTIDPRQLLRRLEPAVRPTGAASAASRRASVADGEFTELFSLARDGGLESAREPELADGATLEPATLAQVARALDLAEARGSRRSVVVAEGRAFVADIPSRRLERLETRDDFVFTARATGPRALPPREIAEQFESLRIGAATQQRASA